MNEKEQDINFKSLFLPLTNSKAVLVIFIIGFIVYFNMLFNGFVLDDIAFVLNNPVLKNFNLFTLIGPNMFNSSGYFRPIPAIYFSILYNLFSNSPFFYHFFQLSLHVLAAVLLYLVFNKFFNKPLSLFLSLIFLIHPINVESVAYIGASQSQLYFLFGGLAFYLALKKLTTKNTLLMHLFLLLAILVKETSILYFLLIYLYLWLKDKSIPRLVMLTSFITLSIYTAIRFSSLGTILEKLKFYPISQLPFDLRLAHIPTIFFYYLKTFFFPMVLVTDQVWTIKNINLSTFYFPLTMSLLFLGCVFGVFYYLLKKKSKRIKLFIFFLVWFLAGIAFLLQIFPLDMTVADRWFYLPMIGLLGMSAIVLECLWPYVKKYEKFCLTLAVILLIILSLRTVIRNNNWRTAIALYSNDAKAYPNYDLENYLGTEYLNNRKYSEALIHFKKSVALFPNDVSVYNIGTAYMFMGNYTKAKEYFLKSFYMKHFIVGIRQLDYNSLAKILAYYETPTHASIEFLKKGVQEYPKDMQVLAALAYSEYRMHDSANALIAAEKVRELTRSKQAEYLYTQILTNKEIDIEQLK